MHVFGSTASKTISGREGEGERAGIRADVIQGSVPIKKSKSKSSSSSGISKSKHSELAGEKQKGSNPSAVVDTIPSPPLNSILVDRGGSTHPFAVAAAAVAAHQNPIKRVCAPSLSLSLP